MNMTKRLLSVILLLTMVLCLVACAGGEETKHPTVCTTQPLTTTDPTTAPTTAPATEPEIEYTYSVRVLDQNGNPIEGAIVSFGLNPFTNYETNADGFALINVEVANGYKARIERLPEGYEDYVFMEEYILFAPGQNNLILAVIKPVN